MLKICRKEIIMKIKYIGTYCHLYPTKSICIIEAIKIIDKNTLTTRLGTRVLKINTKPIERINTSK